MKYAVLSISLLLSTVNIYCMDTEKTESKKLSSLEVAFKEKNKDGDAVIHTIVKHSGIVKELQENLNPIPCKDDMENIFDVDDLKQSLAGETLKDRFRQGMNRRILADAEVPDIQSYAEKIENSIVTSIKILHNLQLDLNMQNKAGKTALYLAAKYKMPKVVQTLLDLGANPNIADKTGYTPLMIACAQSYNSAVVSALLQGNADVNAIVGKNNKSNNMSLNEAARICIENTNAILEHLKKESKSTKIEETQDKDKYTLLTPNIKEILARDAESIRNSEIGSMSDSEESDNEDEGPELIKKPEFVAKKIRSTSRIHEQLLKQQHQ